MADTLTHLTARKPAWLKVPAPGGPNYLALKHLMRDLKLHTVCEEAHCPNIGECWEHRAATFMILGDVCTRNCAYCAVAHGTPVALDTDEPARLAAAVDQMDLRHVVITSVDRDDLPNGGAEIFAAAIAEIRRRRPGTSVEVLIPDFKGSERALRIVVEAKPDILNHNLETIERLYRLARPGGRYSRALELLRRAKEMDAGTLTKSGIICGLGEDWDELLVAMRDLRAQDVDILTIGQYLRPSSQHLPIARYYTPDSLLRSAATASRWAIVTWKPARWCARATTRGSRWRERPPLARPLTDRHGHGYRPDHRRARPTRAGAAHAASDAPDPPFRREGRRSVRLGQDRRLLSSLHRPGGGGGRRALRTARRRLRDFLLPRARAGAGAGRAGERGHGRAIRQGDGLLEGEGWLDAPVRRRAAVHGRSRDRRRPHPARRRPRFRDPLQGRRPGLHLLLRRGSGQHRRLPRDVEHGLRLQAAGDLFVREQPLRHGHGVRARGGRHRRRGARLQLRHGGGAGERHGRARGIRGDPARRRARAQGRPPDPARGSDLPFHGPLDVRPVARRVPHQRRSRGAAQARPQRVPHG